MTSAMDLSLVLNHGKPPSIRANIGPKPSRNDASSAREKAMERIRLRRAADERVKAVKQAREEKARQGGMTMNSFCADAS